MSIVHRYEHFEAPEAIEAHTEPSTRIAGGTISYTNGDSAPQTARVMRHSEGRADGSSGGSVAATFDGAFGKPTVCLEPGNPSSRTRVEVAERMGLIYRTADGRWVDTGSAGQQAPAVHQQAPQQQQPEQNHFNVQHTQELDATIAGLPDYAVSAAQARLVALLAHDTGSMESIAAQLAEQVPGMDPVRALRLVQDFQRVHESALEGALLPLGMDADQANAFIGEFKQSSRHRYQDALQTLIYERSPRLFVAAARDYMRRHAPAVDGVAGKPPASAVRTIPSSDAAMHAAFEQAGFEVGTYEGTMYLRKAEGKWVSAGEVLSKL
jgi:hypothetical protein